MSEEIKNTPEEIEAVKAEDLEDTVEKENDAEAVTEESEQEWGLLHTEINGKEICRKYPGIAGNYGGFYQNIYEHLCLGQPLETHAQDILNVIRIIEAAYQSHRDNKIVNLK